jgi:hypothetical protein
MGGGDGKTFSCLRLSGSKIQTKMQDFDSASYSRYFSNLLKIERRKGEKLWKRSQKKEWTKMWFWRPSENTVAKFYT